MIFAAQQMLEKCCEQHQDVYMAIVDLRMAFDTFNRDFFIAMLQQFYASMCAHVFMVGSLSSCLPVDVAVKQGCVLDPIILNLFLVAMTLVSHCDLQSDCVVIEYRFHSGLFKL